MTNRHCIVDPYQLVNWIQITCYTIKRSQQTSFVSLFLFTIEKLVEIYAFQMTRSLIKFKKNLLRTRLWRTITGKPSSTEGPPIKSLRPDGSRAARCLTNTCRIQAFCTDISGICSCWSIMFSKRSMWVKISCAPITIIVPLNTCILRN